MIEFENVCCGYNKRQPVFEKKSFCLPTNQITFILGANGTGKTTLLRSLIGQIKPFSGSIRIDGKDTEKMSVQEMSRLIAYVPQSIDIGVDYKVLDFIAFGRTPYLNMFQAPSKADYEIAEEMTKRNKISHLCDKPLNLLSGGERQLVYITRAMIQHTPYIVMDEPMSALDFSNQAMILETIAGLTRENKTVLLTSHNPNHALAINSQVCLVDRDRNITQGEANTVLRNQSNITNTFGKRVIYEESAKGHISFDVLKGKNHE